MKEYVEEARHVNVLAEFGEYICPDCSIILFTYVQGILQNSNLENPETGQIWSWDTN